MLTTVSDMGYVAAWVPDDVPQRPRDEAVEMAVQWVLGEADRLGAPPLLVSPTRSQSRDGAIQWLADNHLALTPRGRRSKRLHGPVLAYAPDYDTFHLAANLASGKSLAVVESISGPLRGWAMEVGALDLSTSESTIDLRTKEQREQFDRIHSYGNNGWTAGFGKDQAVRLLAELKQQGLLDSDLVLGYMLATGHNGEAVDRLAKLIDTVGITPPLPGPRTGSGLSG